MNPCMNDLFSKIMNPRFKILIVDDLADNIQVLMRHFEALHPEYILYQATTAQSAFGLALNARVDIVISDWEMPEMSGIELVRMLKGAPLTCHIPVIIVSGVMLSAADLQEALTAGAYDYLRKPVDPVELVARTNSAVFCVKMHLKELAAKNLELSEKALLLSRNNRFNSELTQRLQQLESILQDHKEAVSAIRCMIDDLEGMSREGNWGHFETAFHNVHPEFSQNITRRFPTLTPAELRQCILIRLGMNNKDMAGVLYQSTESIKVTRSRIRRKLSLGNETNLQSYLMMF